MSTQIQEQIKMLQEAARRRKRVIQLAKQGLSFEEIGGRLGVTRQRAHAIWKKAMGR